ncbi:serine threonine kinase [Fusarium mundagurra]|uniref:Serine threonine kinase n=1 Tax=Fusarium mundagurra TaxID=1567541 RepID=A0A8H6DJS7_9HYPO|nr:serine threonine kinase [Fusarium mundagurra]
MELGLSIYQSSVTTGELLSLLINTAREARRLKNECEAVRKQAEIVKSVLDKNQEILRNDECEKKLRDVVKQLFQFVLWCKDANFLQRVWEVTWKKRLPRLVQELMTWALILSVGTTASARSELLGLITNVNRSEQLQRKDTSELMERMRGQSMILDEMMKVLKEEDTPMLQVDFRDSDPRLALTKDPRDDALLSGELFPHDSQSGSVKVLCEPVNESLMQYGEKGPRHVLIYAQISANAGVQPFYGIAERFGKRWTVMKDLRDMPTLASTIKSGTWPKPLSQRLSVAYEVAKTMEYLHSVEILVKRLSDRTVVLEEIDGTITPYLTNLESARLFKERTTGGRYDLRYEAPEVVAMKKRQHTIYTDIWSLGIFIWQCATGSFPFALTDDDLEGSSSDAATIRDRTSKGEVLWSHGDQDSASLQAISRLVKQCCNGHPTSRSSASEVVHSLFEIMTTPAQESNDIASVDGEATKERVAKLLESGVDEKLSEPDNSTLRTLADQGDATAAYLLGSAIWKGRADLDEEVQGGLIVVPGKHREQEMRAFASLVHLQFAFQSGTKIAAEDLIDVHSWLARLYKTKYSQAKELKSL